MKIFIFVLFFMALNLGVHSQSSLDIQTCYALAEENYPLTKQREVIRSSKEFFQENLRRSQWPQLIVAGQATYQSEVTQLPIQLPGQDIQVLSKDQYRLYGEISQALYQGGLIRYQKEAEEARALSEEQGLEAELYKLKGQINQLYFGLLLVDEQLKQLELLKADIQLGIKKAEAGVAGGVAFQSGVDLLMAERLKAEQKNIELRAMRRVFMDRLGMFIHQELSDGVVFEIPPSLPLSDDMHRPEVIHFQSLRRTLGVHEKILQTKTLPRLSLFFQGGMGRPALNMLSNAFEPYYLGGLRLSWNFAAFYTLKNEKSLNRLNQRKIDIQEETFLFQTHFNLLQQDVELEKWNQLLLSDDEIIALREKIKKATLAQLENGVIGSSDYLREVYAEDLARQDKSIHLIQKLLTQYNRGAILGSP